MQLISKRLRSLYISTFFAGLMFQDAIFLPYMHQIGLTASQITLYVVIKYSLVLAIEIPSGILADRWSRKGVLLIGMTAMLVGLIIAANARNFGTFIVAGMFFSIYTAALTGMKEAIVYDTVLEMDVRKVYESQLSRLRMYGGIASVSSSLLGGVFAVALGFSSAFYAGSLSCLVAILFLLKFREPQLHRQIEAVKLLRHISSLMRSIGKSREVKLLVVVGVLAGIEINYMQQLDQLWPIALVLPVILYGPLNAFLLSYQAVPAIIIKRLIKQPSYIGFLGIALVISACGLIIRNIFVVAASEFLLLAMATTLMILLSGRIQDELPSTQRSGVESAVSTIATIAFIGTALIFSTIAKSYSVFMAAWVLVIVAILAAIGAQITLSKISLETNG